MDEPFLLTVTYKGKEYNFETRLQTTGYNHKFHVMINELEVTYEPDEERNYRAMLAEGAHAKVTDNDRALIQVVGDKIQSVFGQE